LLYQLLPEGNKRCEYIKCFEKLFFKKETFTKKAHAVAKGTGIIFIGTIIGMLLGFVGRVIIARFLFLFHSEGCRRKNDADV